MIILMKYVVDLCMWLTGELFDSFGNINGVPTVAT